MVTEDKGHNRGLRLAKTVLERATAVLADAGVPTDSFKGLKSMSATTGSQAEVEFNEPEGLKAAAELVKQFDRNFKSCAPNGDRPAWVPTKHVMNFGQTECSRPCAITSQKSRQPAD
jgi:hypothetical protein